MKIMRMAAGHVIPQPEFDTASASSDSQFTENDEDLSFFEACCECDDDALYDLIQNGTTWEQVNERDKSGRVSRHVEKCTLSVCVITRR